VGVFPRNPHETSLVHSGLPRGLKGLLHMLNAIVIPTKVCFSIFFFFYFSSSLFPFVCFTVLSIGYSDSSVGMHMDILLEKQSLIVCNQVYVVFLYLNVLLIWW